MSKQADLAPQEIEAASFAIIEREFGERTGLKVTDFSREEFAVIRRVIHATADFSFAHSLRFHPLAIATAIARLRAGRAVATDVNMTAAGISKAGLAAWGCPVICELGGPPPAAGRAGAGGRTRAELGILAALARQPGIVAIGNAPTALLAVIDYCQRRADAFDGVVIGAPVGFVNALESKEMLSGLDIPHLTPLGRKGGSPVAAAIVNALIRLAGEGS